MTARVLRYYALELPVTWRAAADGSFSRGRNLPREVRLLVLHSAECGESAGAAEALADWSAGSQHPRASWHFAVDSDSITQSVELDDIAWHAGQVNGFSIGIEQAGRASQTAEQWADPYSEAMLDRVARLLAALAGLYDLPLDHCSDPSVPEARGVCLHADVTRAWHVRGGHVDPGPHYPLERVLEAARAHQLAAVSGGQP